jgi:hypothetical protein
MAATMPARANVGPPAWVTAARLRQRGEFDSAELPSRIKTEEANVYAMRRDKVRLQYINRFPSVVKTDMPRLAVVYQGSILTRALKASLKRRVTCTICPNARAVLRNYHNISA